MVLTDIKTDVKQQEIKKKTSSFIYNFLQGYLLSKPEIHCITGIYISFNLGWSYSIQLDIAR